MKRVISIALAALILAALCMTAVSAFDNPPMYDEAELLTESDNREVQAKLQEVTDKHGVDVAVLTVDNYEESTIDEAAENVCKYSGALAEDCVLFMISMDNRKWCIAANNKGHDAFTAYGREFVGEELKPLLSDSDYKEAFLGFADYADQFLTEAEKGTPYDTNHKYTKLSDVLKRGGISLGIGLLIAIIAALALKSKYKPVRFKAEANDYLVQGSLELRQSYDHFLYTHTTRTRRKDDNDSGSSSHDSGSFGSSSGSF